MPAKNAKEIVDYLRENGMMSEHDLENLSFLLSADESTIRSWYDFVEKEDVQYARELLNAAHQIFAEIPADMDVTQAKQILKKFML